MDKKVSIIVPVYNVAAYLDECIVSLLNQTYSNLEIILVDDGSTDGSSEICEKYTYDHRVKVIHQQNGGAGKAKNTALDAATGDYIAFLDADDYWELNYTEKMLSSLDEKGADIVQCALSKFRRSATSGMENLEPGEYTTEEFLELFLHGWTAALFANKLFKRETLEGVRFYVGRVIDDEFFTYKAVMKAKKVIVLPDGLYRYRQRKTGVTNQGRWKQRMLDRLAYYTERYGIVTKAYPTLKQGYLFLLADDLMRAKAETNEFPELTKQVNKCMRYYAWQVVFSKMPFKKKVGYFQVLCKKPAKIGKAKEDKNWQDFYD